MAVKMITSRVERVPSDSLLVFLFHHCNIESRDRAPKHKELSAKA